MSLTPIHALQLVLVLFTVPHLLFADRDEVNTIGVLLFAFEIFGGLFTAAFIFLALMARKRIVPSIWVTSAVVIILVGLSIYLRATKS